MIPTIIAQCLEGRGPIRLGNLTPTRDMNYVSNTVDGFLAAAESEQAVGETINLGSSREISIGDLTRMIAEMTGAEIEIACEDAAGAPGEERGRTPPGGRVSRPTAARLGAEGKPRRGPAAHDRLDAGTQGNLSARMSIPFEPGAPATGDMIPLSVPELRGNEWKYVKECLDTNWVSSVGPFVDRFEQAMASYVGCRRAVATVNGTAALHVALRVVGVQPDDEVLVSDLTFIAPVNAIRYLGAWPVLRSTRSPTTGKWIRRRRCTSWIGNACGATARCGTRRRDVA